MRNNTNFSREELLEAFRRGGEARQDALKFVFSKTEHRDKAIRFLQSRGCLREDAEDIYQDAIIIFNRQASTGSFRGESTIQNYILSIVKMCWFNKYRKTKRRASHALFLEQSLENEVYKYYRISQRRETMKSILSPLGPRCEKLLLMFAYGYESEHIATATGLRDSTHVRKEKYRCLNRMRKKITEDSALASHIKNQLRTE